MIRINDHIEIDFDTNEIITQMEGMEKNRIKVEPRIMHVLQILLKHSPRVVSREQLIAEVWDNYGGADDALNQSISHLRKLLNDTDRENRIIETVVKKGYRFTGHSNLAAEANTTGKSGIGSKLWILLIVLAVVCLTVVGFVVFDKDEFVPAPESTTEPPTETPAPKADN